jgi:hypothetical protein
VDVPVCTVPYVWCSADHVIQNGLRTTD